MLSKEHFLPTIISFFSIFAFLQLLHQLSACRCVCPGGTKGPSCKVLARTFDGDGWLWLDPLPPCSPTFLSLRLLTSSPNALLLHSGPLDTHHLSPLSPSPQLTLQLTEGQPHLEVKDSSGSISLKLKATLHDGVWHSLYLHLAEKVCQDGWLISVAFPLRLSFRTNSLGHQQPCFPLCCQLILVFRNILPHILPSSICFLLLFKLFNELLNKLIIMISENFSRTVQEVVKVTLLSLLLSQAWHE